MVNNIRNNTIREISAKKALNTLNKIKDAEIIKYKNHTPKHKELLNLFNNLLDIILSDKTLESESQEDENENDKTLMSWNNDYENKNENENDKTLMSSKDENENDLKDDGETMSQNEKNEIIKRKKCYFRWNNWQIKIIQRTNKIVKKTRGFKRVLAL